MKELLTRWMTQRKVRVSTAKKLKLQLASKLVGLKVYMIPKGHCGSAFNPAADVQFLSIVTCKIQTLFQLDWHLRTFQYSKLASLG